MSKPADTHPGGKAAQGVRQTLINLIPPHDTYTAPFAGYDAIGRFKKPAARNTFVDVDERTLHRLRRALASAAGDVGVLFEFIKADAFEYLRQRFELCRIYPPAPEPKHLRAEFRHFRSYGERVDFVYLDPPYPLGTRVKKKIYDNELSDDDHHQLLGIALALPCFVMISSYSNPLYDDALADWWKISYNGQTRGGQREESVWLNYPPPDRLHDSRYVGADRRERERIRRRARNMLAGIEREPPLEAQLMLDEVRARLRELDAEDGGA